MNIKFEKVVTEEQIKKVAEAANIVWHEAYKEIVSLAQIDYMIEKFQSFGSLSEAINKNNYLYYLIKVDDTVAGYIGLQEKDGKMFLSKLYILKEFRGKQVSSKTFEFIENSARNKKLKSVWLTANKNNTHAIEVYKHKGFVVIRTQVTDIGNGFVMDDYVFEKTL
ncbi:GNAT family N-acetyltransferase [Candidatus Ruminimicrobium bovinum]|uniref:GNAT family N-acetyltransferase n=1 Tax=Candidatus Ruminimicrobium bovinum TaxID=3242779 RepID=UPI0039B9A9FD